MKDFPAALQAHYAGGATTLARLWRIVRTDKVVLTFTDHDQPITRLGLTYQPSSAFDASALATKADMSVANLELTGLLSGDGITAEDIESGLWDGASVTLYEVNYRDPEGGANILHFGEIGEIQRKPGLFVAELRGVSQKLQNVVGRIVLASCDAELGDSRCKVDLEALRVSGVVTAPGATSRGFVADLRQRAGYFTFGVVTWVTGANAQRRMEVKQQSANGAIELQLEMRSPIAAGDSFTITPGCNKIGRGPLGSRPVPLTDKTFSATEKPALITATVGSVLTRDSFNTPQLANAGLTWAAADILWTSGANVGTYARATRNPYADDGTFSFDASTPQPMRAGDGFVAAAAASIAGNPLPIGDVGSLPAVGDCQNKFNNLVNFRGFEDIPGQDKIYLYGGQ